MMQINEIKRTMEEIANPGLAVEWDNPGMQVNVGMPGIESVLIALDVTTAVIEEAKAKKAGLIIAHHPLIFSNLKSVDCNTVTGNLIIELIKSGISVYSAHTNFDEAPGGNNDYIASVLGLVNVKKLEAGSFGRIGEFPSEMTLAEAGDFIKETLELKYLKTVGDPDAVIKKVGLCSGAGGDMISAAISEGCDLFVTGDVKHHEALGAAEKGICVIDAGHYGTEKIFVKNLAAKLTEMTKGKLEIIESATEIDPFRIP